MSEPTTQIKGYSKSVFLTYVWLIISSILTGIDLINVFDTFWPAVVKWNDFLTVLLGLVTKIKEIVLLPVVLPLEWIFNFSFPAWLKTYLFIGGLVISMFFLGGRAAVAQLKAENKIQSEEDERKIFEDIIGFILLSLIWPLFIFLTIIIIRIAENKDSRRKAGFSAKDEEITETKLIRKASVAKMILYLKLVLFFVLLLSAINYVLA